MLFLFRKILLVLLLWDTCNSLITFLNLSLICLFLSFSCRSTCLNVCLLICFYFLSIGFFEGFSYDFKLLFFLDYCGILTFGLLNNVVLFCLFNRNFILFFSWLWMWNLNTLWLSFFGCRSRLISPAFISLWSTC